MQELTILLAELVPPGMGTKSFRGELSFHSVLIPRMSQSQEESTLVSAGRSTAAQSTEAAVRWGGSAGTSHVADGTWLLLLSHFFFTELPESWADMQEPLLEGMCFTLKYLGMTLVEKPKGEDMAAAAIRRIIAMAQVGARKFQKVILTVSPRGISLQDADTKEIVENISIYRISYCTTDKLQNKIFAYVAQSQESGALECHAFLSPKKKIAQAVTLTVAQAFQMALDLWEAANAGSRQEQPLHLPCVLEHSEPGRASEPAPPGSPPFRHQFREEEEEEEDENLDETLSGRCLAVMGVLFSSKAAWRSWGGESTAQQS
eukprot:XP_012952914.1 low density lipoprotein receptor adapter protein 1 isoform X6 [Anas platyrhynchos]